VIDVVMATVQCAILNCSCPANKVHVLKLFNTTETIKDKNSNHNYTTLWNSKREAKRKHNKFVSYLFNV